MNIFNYQVKIHSPDRSGSTSHGGLKHDTYDFNTSNFRHSVPKDCFFWDVALLHPLPVLMPCVHADLPVPCAQRITLAFQLLTISKIYDYVLYNGFTLDWDSSLEHNQDGLYQTQCHFLLHCRLLFQMQEKILFIADMDFFPKAYDCVPVKC